MGEIGPRGPARLGVDRQTYDVTSNRLTPIEATSRSQWALWPSGVSVSARAPAFGAGGGEAKAQHRHGRGFRNRRSFEWRERQRTIERSGAPTVGLCHEAEIVLPWGQDP